MSRLLTVVAVSFICAGALRAAQPATSQEEVPTLLVLPVAAPAGKYEWVGRAIQQDMAVDLTRMTRARVISPSGPPARDASEALRAARDAGAQYVVHALAQISGDQLRVSGQLSEVSSGKVFSPIQATAPLDDLFPLEDALAVQVARGLPASLAVNLPAPQTQPSAPAQGSPVAAVSGPPEWVSVQTPAPSYYAASGGGAYYAYPYPYAYYGYPYYYGGFWAYGWWGPGVVIVHHGWDHGGWDHDGDHWHGWADGHPVGGGHPSGGHVVGGGGMHGR